MDIRYLEEYGTYKIDTDNTSYIISRTDGKQGFIGHVYYGPRIGDDDVRYMTRVEQRSLPSSSRKDEAAFRDVFPGEYSGYGVGDFRDCAFMAEEELWPNARTTEFKFRSAEIKDGRPQDKGFERLPHTFGDKARTLIIKAEDAARGIALELYYTVYEGSDAIIRSARISNARLLGDICIRKAMSASMDMDAEDYRLLTQYGTWGREKYIEINPISHGRHNVFLPRYSAVKVSVPEYADFVLHRILHPSC